MNLRLRCPNAAGEGFSGVLKGEQANRGRYLTLAGARSNVFDSIDRVHNPRMQLTLDCRDHEFMALTQLHGTSD